MRLPVLIPLAALALAGCGKFTPTPPPKPVATVVEACGAARAYVTYRNATAHTQVVFPQTTWAVGATPSQTPGILKAGTGSFPRLGIGSQGTVFSLPADCLAGLAQKPAGPDSPGQQFGTDFALPPILTDDGSEATIVADERCDERRCLVGELTYLKRNAAGVWAVVDTAPGWKS